MTECYFFLKWIFPQLIHQVDTGWYALFVERFGSFQEKTFSFYNSSFPLFPRFYKRDETATDQTAAHSTDQKLFEYKS